MRRLYPSANSGIDLPQIALPTLAAMIAGAAIALLPASTAAIVLGFLALAVLTLIEPMAGVVALLLIAPLKTLIETETVYPLPLDIGQITLVVVVACWALNRIARRQPLSLRLDRIQVPLIIVFAAGLLSLPGAISPGAALEELFKWAEMIFLVTFCLSLYRRGDAGWLVFAMVIAGGVHAVIGLYEFFGGSGAEHLWILNQTRFRAFGTFGQPNPFGAFMGIALPLALTSAAAYLSRVWRAVRERWPTDHHRQIFKGTHLDLAAGVFYTVMTVLIGAALYASWSRGAQIGFAAGLLAIILFATRWPGRVAALLVFVAVVGLALWSLGLIPTSITARLSGVLGEFVTLGDARGVNVTDANYSIIERVAHWQSAIRMAEEHPWLGVGFGNYEVAYSRYALLNWPLALGHAHNYYLNLLAEVGLVGLAVYIFSWGMIFILTVRQWRRSVGLERAWSIGLLAAWSHLTVHNLVDKLYVNNLFLQLGFMFGLLAVLSTTDHEH